MPKVMHEQKKNQTFPTYNLTKLWKLPMLLLVAFIKKINRTKLNVVVAVEAYIGQRSFLKKLERITFKGFKNN
jgi:hypothetical protein